jgi:hypothetical protein
MLPPREVLVVVLLGAIEAALYRAGVNPDTACDLTYGGVVAAVFALFGIDEL